MADNLPSLGHNEPNGVQCDGVPTVSDLRSQMYAIMQQLDKLTQQQDQQSAAHRAKNSIPTSNEDQPLVEAEVPFIANHDSDSNESDPSEIDLSETDLSETDPSKSDSSESDLDDDNVNNEAAHDGDKGAPMLKELSSQFDQFRRKVEPVIQQYESQLASLKDLHHNLTTWKTYADSNKGKELAADMMKHGVPNTLSNKLEQTVNKNGISWTYHGTKNTASLKSIEGPYSLFLRNRNEEKIRYIEWKPKADKNMPRSKTGKSPLFRSFFVCENIDCSSKSSVKLLVEEWALKLGCKKPTRKVQSKKRTSDKANFDNFITSDDAKSYERAYTQGALEAVLGFVGSNNCVKQSTYNAMKLQKTMMPSPQPIPQTYPHQSFGPNSMPMYSHYVHGMTGQQMPQMFQEQGKTHVLTPRSNKK